MRFAVALMLCSCVTLPMLAQDDPPPEVDQALRARVTEFFQDHVDGHFRNAEALVAEDTKDYYFEAAKNRFTSFTIGEITYSAQFAKAVVKVDVKRLTRFGPGFPETLVDTPMTTTWKIEDGKWVWYLDPSQRAPNPMGSSASPQTSSPPDSTTKLPDLSDKAMKERAQEILKKSGVDKIAVSFPAASESSDQVTFHNGQQGTVRIYLDAGPPVDGFTAKLEKTDVKANEDVVVSLHYAPGKKPPPERVVLKLNVMPFSQSFPIIVNFPR